MRVINVKYIECMRIICPTGGKYQVQIKAASGSSYYVDCASKAECSALITQIQSLLQTTCVEI